MTKRDSKGKVRKPKKSAKRPADVNQLAHYLGVISTGEASLVESFAPPSALDISRVMAAMGRKGGKIGGKRRAQSMTAEQRRKIALKAARARWDKNGRG